MSSLCEIGDEKGMGLMQWWHKGKALSMRGWGGIRGEGGGDGGLDSGDERGVQSRHSRRRERGGSWMQHVIMYMVEEEKRRNKSRGEIYI